MEQMSGPDTAIRRMTEEICAILGEDIPPPSISTAPLRSEIFDRAEALDPAVQRYADVLEQELQVMQLPKAPS